jgi:serine/threonine-protein kinase
MGPSLSAVTPGVARQEAREQLQKILRSSLFTRSKRMSRFLCFGVEYALKGSSDQVKEYLVGVEVFDRSKDYDPRVDPIVRVEARRLRAKLRAYYSSAGKKDEIRIEFPKGAYAAEFRRRTPAKVSVNKPPKNVETSIAVLPFSNLSPEAGDDYFSDGLTEELILHLTRLKDLRVVAWYSASKFRGREHDLSAIRQELHASLVLLGSVRRTGTRVRVTAQLVDTASGAYLWSEAFERSATNVVGIQQEIASSIVVTLRPALGRTPVKQQHHAVKKINPECYNLCLQGRFHANRRTPEAIERSLRCYQKAVMVDPHSAAAYAGLADAYSLIADYGIIHPHKMMPLAETSALRAQELDPNSAEVHTSLAFIRSRYQWKWREGEALYRRAIELNPSYSRAYHWFASDLLALVGRFDEAEETIVHAIDLDPLSMIVHECLAYVRMVRREYAGAMDVLKRMIDLDPTFAKAFGSRGRLLSLMGKYEEACQSFHKALELGSAPNTLAALGQTLALAGQEAEARKYLRQLEVMAESRYVASNCFAVVHLGLNEVSISLDWLERSVEQRELATATILTHPLWDPLLGNPRFERLRSIVGSLR